MIYVDSSLLLELYLGGESADKARALLDEPIPKVSSWLLMAEVPIVLRRLLSAPGHAEALARCLARFDADVEDIGLIDSLTDVALRIKSDPRFSRCRALDAIHACTAMLLREWTGHSVRMGTFDRRLGSLAGELGIGVG